MSRIRWNWKWIASTQIWISLIHQGCVSQSKSLLKASSHTMPHWRVKIGLCQGHFSILHCICALISSSISSFYYFLFLDDLPMHRNPLMAKFKYYFVCRCKTVHFDVKANNEWNIFEMNKILWNIAHSHYLLRMWIHSALFATTNTISHLTNVNKSNRLQILCEPFHWYSFSFSIFILLSIKINILRISFSANTSRAYVIKQLV